MRLHILGVNGPYPESHGATSGYLLEAGDDLIQFDMGCGVLSELTALTPPELISAICVSHWHFDHTSDLLPMIYRLEAAGKQVPVYGPVDEHSAIRKIVDAAGCFDLHNVAAGDRFAIGKTAITVCPARHPVPAVGFRAEQEGRIFGFTGDTNTLEALNGCYRGCHLLLADGLFPEADWTEEKPHLSAILAARLGQEAGAEKLVITHLNPSYPSALLLKEARTAYHDPVLAAPGMTLAV